MDGSPGRKRPKGILVVICEQVLFAIAGVGNAGNPQVTTGMGRGAILFGDNLNDSMAGSGSVINAKYIWG